MEKTMRKVITYGTYDLLHYGHVRLLERARALGDYLIVGVTTEDFDKARGKINVQQSLIERMEGVRATGLADEIIVEEYEGQKIDDIKRYHVDVFAIGSDWVGKFDYLKEYCEVVYLDRTEGVSSTERRNEHLLKLGLLGQSTNVDKVQREAEFVNGLSVEAVADGGDESTYDALLEKVDAVYIYSHPSRHYRDIRKALLSGKHVLVETPVTLRVEELHELQALASEKGLILMEALKTAFSTAYNRLVNLLKSGKIGELVSVDSACTSMENVDGVPREALRDRWNSIYDWGPTGLLPIFQLLGTNVKNKRIVSSIEHGTQYDYFSKIDFIFPKAVASTRVGKGVKTEGELIVSGTKGYAYVPAPWWKTDNFEIRFEDPRLNQRYFYMLEGEGIRYELVAFLHAVQSGRTYEQIDDTVTEAIVQVMEDYTAGKDLTVLG